MNFYPYYNFPYTSFTQVPKVGGLKSLFGNIKWGSILSGTQKTLNVINQAIPIIKQAGPVINNAKTMFRVMNEFKKVDLPQENIIQNNISNNINSNNTNDTNIKTIKKIDNGPVFFQ